MSILSIKVLKNSDDNKYNFSFVLNNEMEGKCLYAGKLFLSNDKLLYSINDKKDSFESDSIINLYANLQQCLWHCNASSIFTLSTKGIFAAYICIICMRTKKWKLWKQWQCDVTWSWPLLSHNLLHFLDSIFSLSWHTLWYGRPRTVKSASIASLDCRCVKVFMCYSRNQNDIIVTIWLFCRRSYKL